MLDSETQSYYEILDINSDATLPEIKQAYLRVKSAYGKDSVALYSLFDSQETKNILQKVEEAFHILSNPEKRKEYDRFHGIMETSLPSYNHPQPNNRSRLNVVSEQDHAQTIADGMFGSSSIEEDLMFNDKALDNVPPKTPNEEPPQRTLSSTNTSSSYENKLGIIKRIALTSAYLQNEEIEEEIEKESVFSGAFLKKIREYRQIRLDEMAEFTKISKLHIENIENEEFKKLPSAVYTRGFVIQIAKAMKLPHEKVASAYMTRYKTSR